MSERDRQAEWLKGQMALLGARPRTIKPVAEPLLRPNGVVWHAPRKELI